MPNAKTISGQLILVFALILGIAAAVGSVGVFGARSITTTIQAAARDALPRAATASALADTASRLEASLIAYMSSPRRDPEIEGRINWYQVSLREMLSKNRDKAISDDFEVLSAQIKRSVAVHVEAATLHFDFDGRTYSIVDFLNMINVETAHYLKKVDEAARFGVFDGLLLDPEQTSFARWAAGFRTEDAELAQLISDYGSKEADLVRYVADKVVPAQNPQSQFVRMQARRLPKLERALGALTEAAEARSSGFDAQETAAIEVLRTDMQTFIADARKEQEEAMGEMKASVERAMSRGRIVMAAVGAVLLIGLGLSVGAAYFTTRRIGVPLRELSLVIRALADRNFDVDVPSKDRSDEIGAIAQSTEIFRENGIAREALELEQVASRKIAEAERIERIERERKAERAAEEKARKAKEAEAAKLAAMQEAAERERQARHAEQSLVVNSLADGLKQLASGDLTTRIMEPFVESYDQLRLDFNDAVRTLSETVGSISGSAGTISGNVAELTSAAEDLSRRTERSAAALEETSAALEELTVSVKSASRSVDEADSIVQSTYGQAQDSRKIVEDAVNAMGGIDNSSKKISKITGVIEDIAFQTNLLALNAGVEAARAGDAGRGFAVVASEVRMLAQRSSEAAREISSLISESGAQVRNGVDLVDKVDGVLLSIVEAVSEISVHVSGIATTTREQAAGIGEINQSVTDMDQATQQNAAMFEETMAATQSLAQEAGSLARAISRFQIEQEGGRALADPSGGDIMAGWAADAAGFSQAS